MVFGTFNQPVEFCGKVFVRPIALEDRRGGGCSAHRAVDWSLVLLGCSFLAFAFVQFFVCRPNCGGRGGFQDPNGSARNSRMTCPHCNGDGWVAVKESKP